MAKIRFAFEQRVNGRPTRKETVELTLTDEDAERLLRARDFVSQQRPGEPVLVELMLVPADSGVVTR